MAKREGWKFVRHGKGSHELYEKEGVVVIIPNHGTKEMPKGLEMKLRKKMGMK